MTVDMTKLVKLQALDALAAKADAKVREVEVKANAAIKSAAIENGNTLKLFTTTDTTQTAAFTLDFPAELVLDTAKTGFISNFSFNSETYAGATDPNLDGKAVLVLAIKSTDKGVVTTSYSFIDINYLVDTYTAADSSVTVNGYTIKVNVSAAADNAITLQNDGLHVDITGKVDKVTTAVADNLAAFVSGGNIADSGYSIAADSEVTTVLSSYFNLDS